MKFKELPPIEENSNLPRLKLADGQSIKGVFRGEPHDFIKHWVSGRTTVCSGRDTCEFCKSNDKNIRKTSFRFMVNFVVKEGGQFVAKVFEGGRPTYCDLAELATKYTLSSYLFSIKRVGMGTDTRYTIMPEPNGQLAGAGLSTIEKVQLNNLALAPPEKSQPREPGSDDDWTTSVPPPAEMDVPF